MDSSEILKFVKEIEGNGKLKQFQESAASLADSISSFLPEGKITNLISEIKEKTDIPEKKETLDFILANWQYFNWHDKAKILSVLYFMKKTEKVWVDILLCTVMLNIKKKIN